MAIQTNILNAKYYDEWAKDKIPFLAMTSLMLASGAEDCLEFLQIVKSGELIVNIINLPPIGPWLNLYRNHRKVYRGVIKAFRELGCEMAQIVDCYEFFLGSIAQCRKMTHKEKKLALEEISHEEFQEMREAIYDDMKEIKKWAVKFYSEDDPAEVEMSADEKRKKARKFLSKPEIIFFFRIWIPCYLRYGTYPIYLLRKARSGDEYAIEILLRLDKSIIDDVRIKEIFHQASVATQRGKFDLMSKAIQRGPKIIIGLQTVKYNLAGLISSLSIALGQKLAASEVHRLFDAIARDTGKGLIDDDLAVSPETFEKGIQRGRKFWQIMPRWTQNN